MKTKLKKNQEYQLLLTPLVRQMQSANAKKANLHTQKMRDAAKRASVIAHAMPKRPPGVPPPPPKRKERKKNRLGLPPIGTAWRCLNCAYTLDALPDDLTAHVVKGGRAAMRCARCKVQHVLTRQLVFGVPYVLSRLAKPGEAGIPVT